ncbi:serine peptidase [Vitreoscilla filiformis]|uniref:Probable periplasmic serine endoprotease DegP-like n=1 Tax=Vitreoscilla filiformis TaxID=63 RepID=A0A221KB28_VITFI|nr:DegQ family serine endoprotease [Vitreoscilla filiformis]ASM76231.1 serine peptidase [Vitreoscilla filiformis]
MLKWVSSVALAATLATAGGWTSAHAQAVRGLPDFTELVEQTGPSVVNIRTLEKTRDARGNVPNLEEFFRRFGIPLPNNRSPSDNDDDAAQRRGIGSGFILSADGFIMTNAHVVDGADELIVTLADKREFKARVIGADKRSDVAVVKIDAQSLPAVKIGDVNRLKVGEWVMAIGSPFGLDNTVTAGIVSAKQRDTGELLPLIQTDVAINPGNSGGPLINLRGEVVGINSQIYSTSGGYAGISFAIPIDEAMRVSDQLRQHGRVIRGRIGVSIAPVTKEVAESLGLGQAVGALVRGTEPGTPADKAGLQAGDIIVKVNGKTVEKFGDLPRIIAAVPPGTRITLNVFRKGAYRDVALTVAESESEASPAASTPDAAQKTPLGLSVSTLPEATRRELRVPGGVKVEAVEGAAARAGLREGDIVLSVNNTDVTDARQFAALVSRLDRNKRVTLLVRRGEWANYVVITPER